MVVNRGALTAHSHRGSFALPTGWEWIELDRAFVIRRGTIDPFKKPSNRFALYSIPAYDKGMKPEFVNGKDVRSAKTLVAKGDVLFSKLNPRIPRVWIVRDNESVEQIASTEFIPLIPKKNAEGLPYFDSDFARVLFLSNIVRNQLVRDVQGATGSRQRIRLQSLKATMLPRPLSLEIQRRIVARIETLMAEIKKASQILAQMRRDTDRIAEIALEEKFAELEKTQIVWLPLGTLLLTKPQYGISKKASDDTLGIPIIRMNNIVNGRLSLGNLKYVSLTSDEVEKYLLHHGDILFNRTNSAELVGKSAVFDSNEPAVFASYLIRLVADQKKAKPHYLAMYINSKRGRMYVQSQLTRAIGQVNVNAKKLAAMPVLTPDLKAQEKIIVHISNIQSEINEMRGSQDQDSALLNQLEQSILERAFRGEL